MSKPALPLTWCLVLMFEVVGPLQGRQNFQFGAHVGKHSKLCEQQLLSSGHLHCTQ